MQRPILAFIASLSVVACGAPPPREPTILPMTPVRAREPEDLSPEGEIAAALAAGIGDEGAFAGGDVRTGFYIARQTPVPMLLSNRFGVDLRLRALYGPIDTGALSGHLLLGAAPSLSWQIGGLGRRATGVRVPSLLGVIAPEPGVWLRAGGRAHFYLGWRAPIAWLPFSEAGLDVAPSFVWAMQGRWLATLSVGGFIR